MDIKTYQYFIILLIFTGGVWSLLASIYNWNSFFDQARPYIVSSSFFNGNRYYTRWFYGFLGTFCVIISLLALFHDLLGTQYIFDQLFDSCTQCIKRDQRNQKVRLLIVFLIVCLCLSLMYIIRDYLINREIYGYRKSETYALVTVLIIGIIVLLTLAFAG